MIIFLVGVCQLHQQFIQNYSLFILFWFHLRTTRKSKITVINNCYCKIAFFFFVSLHYIEKGLAWTYLLCNISMFLSIFFDVFKKILWNIETLVKHWHCRSLALSELHSTFVCRPVTFAFRRSEEKRISVLFAGTINLVRLIIINAISIKVELRYRIN